ncbi:hypothetical protein AAG596_06800 [Citromicrobium bathyomarinum]|uniref:DUF4870 family protein n=1 Tax=Citromicrobium bathyomarinum TaxID=72174 RepID=UPI00315A6318
MSDDYAGNGEGAGGAEPDTGVTLYRPIIVAILYLANLFTGFSVLIGLILAYVWRNDWDVTEWEETHFTYLIRTFWIGFWVCLLVFGGVIALAVATTAGPAFADQTAIDAAPHEPPAGIIAAIFGGVGIGFLMFVWYCVRSILSLANAANRRPMPRPKTWLF